jgi:autotransporter adhesin
MTLKGANGTTISNVADGVAATDAVNKGQMDAGDASTLQSSKTYTDTTATQTLTSANAYTDAKFASWDSSLGNFRSDVERRFSQQDRRIDRQGAMGSAMLNMAINAAGSQSPRGRIAVGAGFQSSEKALSIGYGKRIGTRGSFSLGGAFSGSEKSAGVGFGVDL